MTSDIEEWYVENFSEGNKEFAYSMLLRRFKARYTRGFIIISLVEMPISTRSVKAYAMKVIA